MLNLIARMLICLSSVFSFSQSYAVWNNPYSSNNSITSENTLHSIFSERPKHLDPARSYSSDEAIFTGQIYEPPLQYHYLKRPYLLEPLTLTSMPKVIYKDADGNVLPNATVADKIFTTTYLFTLKPEVYYQPHPALAQKNKHYVYHELTENDLVDIYELKDFESKGTRELTASDYIYQIKRLADPKNHSPISGIIAKLIVGFPELEDTLEDRREVSPTAFLNLNKYVLLGAKALSRYQFSVTIKGKSPQFLYWMAMPFFAPMPWEAEKFYAQQGMSDKNISLDWYPIGTGPYFLAENNPNRRMVLVKNPNYHADYYPTEGEEKDQELGLLQDAGMKLPFIDRIIFSLEKESIPRWNKFLQGYYDRSTVSSDAFDQAIRFGKSGKIEPSPEVAAKGIRLSTTVQPSSFYWGFNMQDPIVGGDSERAKKLRQAIAMVFDVNEYISIFMNGRGITAQGPIPPGIYGHSKELNPVLYDIETQQKKTIKDAKALLSEAGYKDGVDKMTGKPLILNLDIVSSTGPDDKARLSWLRAQFKKIDIQLNIRATQYNRFREKIRIGSAQIFSFGWNADYPDPENFLMLLYGPNGKALNGGENAANYNNQAFNKLFDQMKNMENTPERLVIINKMIEIVREDSPWIWGFHPKSLTLSHNWTRVTKPHAMANNTLKYARIDPKLRADMRESWNVPNIWPILSVIIIAFMITIPIVISYWRKEHRKLKKIDASKFD
jgi:oligopeptide transport system substrate-binding protein